MRAFLIAIQFLTRLPVPSSGEWHARDLGRSMLFYPLVGAIIGVALFALATPLAHASAPLSAALILTVWVVITGALHLDGLADSADAWVGGHGDRERTLAIMKDPRSGPVGVTALVLLLLIKYAALQALFTAGNTATLLLVPLIGRAVLPLLFLTTDYVRAGGLGDTMAKSLPRGGAWAVVAISSVAVVLASPKSGLTLLGSTALLFVALRALMRSRIGGTTGDTAGALVEITEATALCAAVFAS